MMRLSGEIFWKIFPVILRIEYIFKANDNINTISYPEDNSKIDDAIILNI